MLHSTSVSKKRQTAPCWVDRLTFPCRMPQTQPPSYLTPPAYVRTPCRNCFYRHAACDDAVGSRSPTFCCTLQHGFVCFSFAGGSVDGGYTEWVCVEVTSSSTKEPAKKTKTETATATGKSTHKNDEKKGIHSLHPTHQDTEKERTKTLTQQSNTQQHTHSSNIHSTSISINTDIYYTKYIYTFLL